MPKKSTKPIKKTTRKKVVRRGKSKRIPAYPTYSLLNGGLIPEANASYFHRLSPLYPASQLAPPPSVSASSYSVVPPLVSNVVKPSRRSLPDDGSEITQSIPKTTTPMIRTFQKSRLGDGYTTDALTSPATRSIGERDSVSIQPTQQFSTLGQLSEPTFIRDIEEFTTGVPPKPIPFQSPNKDTYTKSQLQDLYKNKTGKNAGKNWNKQKLFDEVFGK